jgi:hypothetical protein
MKPAPVTAGLTFALLALAVAVPALRQAPDPNVEVARLTADNWDQFAPLGKEADAIYGDAVLRNKYLTAIVAEPVETRHANMSVRDIGGALIDFTTRARPADQLGAFYPGKRNFKYNRIATSNRDGRGEVIVSAPATDAKPQVTTTYSLAADQPYLEVTTEFANIGEKPLSFELEDDLVLDGRKEDMIRAPNGEERTFWAYDRHWGQAYGIAVVKSDALTGGIQMNSDARISTLKYLTPEAKTSVTLAPGESLSISRRLFAADDLLNVKSAIASNWAEALRPIQLTLMDGAQQPIRDAVVDLIAASGELYGSARANDDGKLSASLPAGEYAVRVTALSGRLEENEIRIQVGERQNSFELKFPKYQTGSIDVTITDDDDRPIPCKVEFRSEAPVNFGPDTAEFAVRNLRYTPNGRFTQPLTAGEYRVLVSHGPEYDLVQEAVRILPGKTATFTAKLNRSVDTAGWVSGDFHSHSSPSGDNTTSQLGRVLNLVCEHIEFAPCTEHNRIDTYDPHIEQLGIRNFLASVSGMELTNTPLPINHQNAFPLRRKPHTQDNGAPLTAESMDDQIERLALWDDRSEKLVQVNHPDIGWMFYDKDGDGKPDTGFERAVPYMDVMEIHPIYNALHLGPVATFTNGRQYHNTVFRWLQLLNQGYRIYGVVNTDAHYNYHGSGGVRNWIQSSTDDPAKIDPMEIVHAAEQGRVVVSNGPFLEVWASEPGQSAKVTCGQDLAAKSKRVALKVRVQTPNWIDIDRVFVLINGRVAGKHDYSREKTPNVFRSGAVKFDETLEVELTEDAHLIVVAGDVGGRLVAFGDTDAGKQEPAALSNPIYVDIDGDGFTPNKDTLDAPLPVKFGAGQ